MRATIVYQDPINDIEQVEVNGHSIQFGGMGDTFCYAHQTFACVDHLTTEEWAAIAAAGDEPADEPTLWLD